ncbi:sensor histidine kinase [Algoriphagus namhaensis]|uniref:Sensor histidine kinase n=1 Tax=Algoriphagus namhaensis TaxID=915353 RepID=A0ABV8ASB1_9BACT
MHPFSNGFLQFTLGALFILTAFHFFLFFQQKDKIYLLYSGYTFFIILSQFNHLSEGFLFDLGGNSSWIMDYPMIHTEVYYLLYVLFGLEFLNIKKELPRWYSIIKTCLWIIIGYCTLLFLYYLLIDPRIEEVLLKGYYFFTILMSSLGIVTYIPFFKVRTPLKYYMISGSFLLLIFSLTSLHIHQNLKIAGLSVEPSYSILYLGFLLENVLFSLGLGHKQKLILKERNESQQKLISQFEENEKLRIQIQKRLEASVKIMESQAEEEKVKTLKASFDKEIAELKLLALRSQMNPHFIFNSLNSIKSYIIDNKREDAVYYLNKFAKLIRKILASTQEKEISLAEELETMRLYVNIENLRFDQKIEFKIEGEEEVDTAAIKVPSLLLQPFLENAIWHGLSPSTTSPMQLKIRIGNLSEKVLLIEIEDNGVGINFSKKNRTKKVHKKDSLGLAISKERLRHFSQKYGIQGSINVYDKKEVDSLNSGTIASIQISIM